METPTWRSCNRNEYARLFYVYISVRLEILSKNFLIYQFFFHIRMSRDSGRKRERGKQKRELPWCEKVLLIYLLYWTRIVFNRWRQIVTTHINLSFVSQLGRVLFFICSFINFIRNAWQSNTTLNWISI